MDKKADTAVFDPLTRREREVLALLAQGLTSPEIASKLSLATSSVKSHRQNIYGKLGVHTKRQAVARASALGLLGNSAAPARLEPGATPPAMHNLPLQATRFFGREAEVEQVQARLADSRLVTLTGSGGVGKSRLSLRAAEGLLSSFQDGVWLVELAPLSDPALVVQQVATSLSLRDEPGRPILETLAASLHDRQVLLVLDNCEHLLEACAQLADKLLLTCPQVKLLVSSREPLGNTGEAVLVVPSLPFPAHNQTHSLERLGDYASLGLFVDRARLVFPNYQLTPHNMSAVTRVCQRLDGIPLAIEMAAARVRTLTAEQLADRLDDAFRVLAGGSRTALPRHKTLRGTIDWSFDLLSGGEQLLLQRLSVFAGGCLLEAAEAVCSGEGLEADEVLEVLMALVSKSMVITDRHQGEAARYHLLETVRQYAREKLTDAGEIARLQRRHRDYFLSFAETNFPRLQTPEGAVWRPRLAAEHNNLRQAVEWSLSDLSNLEAGPRLLIAMQYGPWHWHQEELDWNLRGLALCQNNAIIPAQLHVKLLEHASTLSSGDDPQTALALAIQAVEISRGLGPEGIETLMWSLFQLTRVLIGSSDAPDQAVTSLAEAEAILLAFGPGYYAPEEGLRVRAHFANQKAELANDLGQYAVAKLHAAESIRLYEASGSRWFASKGHASLGAAHLALGEYQEAEQHFTTGLNLICDVPGWDNSFFWLLLAQVDHRRGNLEQALEYCRKTIRQADRTTDRNLIADSLGVLAALCAKQGQLVRAACLSGASARLWARQKRRRWEDSSLDTLLPGWRDGPDAAAIQRAYDAGHAMSSDEAVAYALTAQKP